MNINIKTTNIELTDSIRDYLDKKMAQVEKFITAPNTEPIADIEIGKTTNAKNSAEDLFKAEINLQIGGKLYRYSAEEAELYAAIDKMKDQITREVRKDKEKRRDFFRRGALKMKEMIRGIGRRSK
ncbi:MAG: ribosome-associated translation inhibitor RaiA [Candidatus Paceibacterota bacterium]